MHCELFAKAAVFASLVETKIDNNRFLYSRGNRDSNVSKKSERQDSKKRDSSQTKNLKSLLTLQMPESFIDSCK